MGSVDETGENTAQPAETAATGTAQPDPRPVAAGASLPASAAPAGGSTVPAGSSLRFAVPPSAAPSPPGAPGPAAGTRPVRVRRWRGRVRTVLAFPRRPAGRLTLSGLLIAVLVAASAVSGAYLVPRVSSAQDPEVAAAPGRGATPPAGRAPSEPAAATPSTPEGAPATGRPADQLAAWAAPIAARLNIPPVVMEAYAYAEIVESEQAPTCQLRWTTLAGIGKVESNHGQAGATLGPDGKAMPSIIGAALDGESGRQRIPDTDGGALDQDSTWDHAVGPMQFIPATWQQFAIDADRDGATDPNDIDDATLAAAQYLCAGGRDLSTAGGWWAAVLAYNDVQAYANDVFDAANDYGQRSR